MNPWEEIPDAADTANLWGELSQDDRHFLSDWFSSQGLEQRGIALVLPLRTDTLMPSAGLWLTPEKWTPERALADIAGGEELMPALCCLRTLGSIEFSGPGAKARRLGIATGASRLSGPQGGVAGRSLAGSWHEANEATVRFSGCETWCPSGEAVDVRLAEDWPSARNYRQELVPAKAEPHGAVIICRSPSMGPEGRLRLRSTVYLPVAIIAETSLPAAIGNIDLLLHGYFFVSSARTEVRTVDEPGAEGRWNAALEAGATLSQVLPALAAPIPALPNDDDRGALLDALKKTDWWGKHRALVCRSEALAQVWDGGGSAKWKRVPAAAVRPIASASSTSRERLSTGLPGLANWCAQTGIVLAHGPILAADGCRWKDAELAAIVRLAGPAAFTKLRIAETIATLLESEPGGPQTQATLAAVLREAILSADRFAPTAVVCRLLAFVANEQLMPLPRSVTSRPLLAALAAAGTMLPLPGEWDVPEPSARLAVETVVNLLSAAAGFVNQGDVGTQAAAVINAVLRRGPPLGELARHPVARKLAIVPVTSVMDRRETVLTLSEAEELGRQGVLFDALPNRRLDLLADAVVDPPVYRLRWQSDGDAFNASNAQPANLITPLRSARRFGEARARGQLANFLSDIADVADLRRLCAADPDLPASIMLVALDSRLAPLVGMLEELLSQRAATTRPIPPRVIGELTDAVKDKLGIETIQPARLGEWLVEAHRSGRLPALPEPIAIALLTSGVSDDVLRTLPLHRTTTGARASVADGLRRAAPGKVPASLAPEALLLNPWNDPGSFAIEQRLVPLWTALDQIEAVLRSASPPRHIEAMAEAIAATNLPAGVASKLATTKWLPLADGAVAPGEVLDLDAEVDRALVAMLGVELAFPTLAKLPHQLRDERTMAKLRDAGVLPGRK